MKALAFGDLQLGLHGRLSDQEEALAQILEVGIEHGVDVILNGGDTFEGPAILPEQLVIFADFVAGARAAGIPVVATSGNGRHDAAVRDTNGIAIFEHIPGVFAGGTPDVMVLDTCTVGVLPWVHERRLVTKTGRDLPRAEVHALMAPLLLDIATGLREDCARFPDRPAILLLHFSISGATLPTGLSADMIDGVVLPLHDLEALGFDAIVASHIHRPQLLSKTPPVLFTGSPLAHDFGEADFDHGCWILDLVGYERLAEFVPLRHRQLVTFDFDHDDVAAQIALSSHIGWAVPGGAIVRVRVFTTRDQWRHVDVQALRRELHEAGASAVRVEPHLAASQRARVAAMDADLDELAAVDLWLSLGDYSDEFRAQLREKAVEYAEMSA